MPGDLDETFDALKKIIDKYASGLNTAERLPGSTAKENKKSFHLTGKKEVSILGRKPQKTYIAGIILHPKSVGFYHMPVYSHPKEFALSPSLEIKRSGKSCFQVKSQEPAIFSELEALLAKGIEIYKRDGWI